MQRFDLSMPLFGGMPAFPGDPPFGTRRVHAIDRGDPYNLSALECGSHVGTHVDPPVHFLPNGASGGAPGAYVLECLPLRLRDGDGGPARALLTSP